MALRKIWFQSLFRIKYVDYSDVATIVKNPKVATLVNFIQKKGTVTHHQQNAVPLPYDTKPFGSS